MTKTHPSQDEINRLLHYEPKTGAWIWLSRSVDMFEAHERTGRGTISAETKCKIWNDRFAGKRAESIDAHGYGVIRVGKTQYKAHLLAAVYMTGILPDMMDHKNRVRSDNRWENLRPATRSQNNANVSARNALGIKGVRLRGNKYEARLSFGGKCHYLGNFDTLDSAKTAVRAAAHKLHGEFRNED